MEFFYSLSARGFYRSDVHGDRMPVDAQPLDEEAYTALLRAQAGGQALDWSGSAPVPLPRTTLNAWTELQVRAAEALKASDGVAMRCVKAGMTYPADWAAYDQALRGIVRAADGDAAAGLPPRPDYPAGTHG
jgi:hypothetical protein